MSKFLILFFALTLVAHAKATHLGDAYIRLGEKINESDELTENQIDQLEKLLTDANDILLNDSNGSGGYMCMNGTVYGPNKFEKWSGDSNGCEDSNKIRIWRHYACVTGTLYGANNFEKWSGDSGACSNTSKIKVGTRYACVTGTIYGPNGFEKWTGDSNYCAKAKLD